MLFSVAMLFQPCLLYTVYQNVLQDWFSLWWSFCRYCIDLHINLAAIITIITQSSNYVEGGQRTASIVCVVCSADRTGSRYVTIQLRDIQFMVAHKIKYLNYSRLVIFDIYLYI